MSPPAGAPLVPWFTPPPAPTAVPVDGVDNFKSLVPVTEPISVGPPPVPPALIGGVSVPWLVASVHSIAGYRHTHAAQSVARPTCSLRWGHLTLAERNAVLAFLHNDVFAGGEGSLYGFDLEPDGPGNGTVIVRAIGRPRDTNVDRGVYEITLDVEQVF